MKEQAVEFMISYGEHIPVISWYASVPDHICLSLYLPMIPTVPICGRHPHPLTSSV